MRRVSEEQRKAARKRAWTNYNKSEKKKAAAKRYYENHKDELYIKGRKWFEAHPEKTREYSRRGSAKRRANGKDAILRAKRKKENPEKQRAKDAANNALRSGKLKRKTKCELCGIGGLLHKHHSDYSKPFDVVWLCPKCHKKVGAKCG